MKDGGKTVRWHLDAEHGVATPEKPAEHLTRYVVPLRPMLGCSAVAASSAQAAPGTGASRHYCGGRAVLPKSGGRHGLFSGSDAVRAALRSLLRATPAPCVAD